MSFHTPSQKIDVAQLVVGGFLVLFFAKELAATLLLGSVSEINFKFFVFDFTIVGLLALISLPGFRLLKDRFSKGITYFFVLLCALVTGLIALAVVTIIYMIPYEAGALTNQDLYLFGYILFYRLFYLPTSEKRYREFTSIALWSLLSVYVFGLLIAFIGSILMPFTNDYTETSIAVSILSSLFGMVYYSLHTFYRPFIQKRS